MPRIPDRTQRNTGSGLSHSLQGKSIEKAASTLPKALYPTAGPGYFSPEKTCRSRIASVERDAPKGEPAQGARKRNLFKNFNNRKQYGIPSTEQVEAFRGEKK